MIKVLAAERFISTQLNIRSLLQKQDKAIFQKGKQHDNQPLKVCLPQEKNNLIFDVKGSKGPR